MPPKTKREKPDSIVGQTPSRIKKGPATVQRKSTLKQANEELSMLNRLIRAVTTKNSLQQACDTAVREIASVLGLDVVILFLQEGDVLRLKAISQGSSLLRKETVPLHIVGQCLCGAAAQKSRLICSKNIHRDKRCTWTECKKAGLHSFAAIPLRIGRQQVGVLSVATADKRDFKQAAHFLKAAADHLAVSIHNAGLFEQSRIYTDQLAQQLNEGTAMEKTLRESERKYRELIDNANSIILRWSKEGKIIFLNEFGQKFFGYPSADIIGRHVVGTIVPETESTGRNLQPLMDNICAHPEEFERNINENMRYNGERVWIAWTNKVVMDESGRVNEILSIGSDITEQKIAEEERQLNEARISALLELSRMTDQADQALTDFALEKAIELTGSTIGYLAFMNEDESVLTMYSWSREAMKECLIETRPLIYPVKTTGLWGEAVRQRKPIITNDYQAPVPIKKGYPAGHVHVSRHMNIPLFDRQKIVLVAGVGNKKGPYGESDIRQLTLLMDGMWKIIKQKRSEDALRVSEEELYKSLSTQTFINLLVGESLKNDPLELILQKALNMILSIPWLPFQLAGNVFLVAETPDMLVMKAGSTLEDGICSQKPVCSRVPFGACPCGIAAATQQIQFCDHAGEHDDRCRECIYPHTHYAVPILFGGRTLGVLNMWAKKGLGRDPITEEFLQIVANTLAGIIERKQAEYDKEKLHTQLLQAKKMEAIGTLAGGVAHDFNNILAGILGYAALALMNTEQSHPSYEKLKTIEQLVDSGAQLTRQLLGFARGGKYQTIPIDMNDLIVKTSDMFGRTKKEITIHRKLQDELYAVEADYGQLEQVLLNLYVNAWQAMPSGGEIYLETQNTVLDERYCLPYNARPGRYITITVTDTGSGMDIETRQRIFDPFFTTKDMGKGTGLGLASAYGIIKNHGGIITVYSEKGYGSTFAIYLPASEKEAGAEKTVNSILSKGKETILIVDDERTNTDVMKELLERLGYTVLTAQSGKKAIELYRAHRSVIRLVILDMIMPGMNGKETLAVLKEIDKNVCILLSSGYSLNGEASKIMEMGCRGFIQKPFRIEELSQRIREALDDGHRMK
jgi:PAS domain S-box-containing protein